MGVTFVGIAILRLGANKTCMGVGQCRVLYG